MSRWYDGAMEDGAKGGLKSKSARSSSRGLRWAVLVGVSEYASKDLRLKFAHRDVQELWRLLQGDRYGGFVEERARVLVDEAATTAAVTDALRSFLQNAKEEDLVFLYFSGHGALDRKSKNQVAYFLTHETDPSNIAGTALPMREIMQSLGENLRAKRVILMMDTCHSAAVEGTKGTSPGRSLAKYLDSLQQSEEGFAIFTSSEASEQSREDEKWGGGHGLFTHLVLEGLRGKADKDQDGIVTLGELFSYVEAQAEKLEIPGQHPRVGERPFDRDFPIAITGGVNARDRLEVGRALLETPRPLRARAAHRPTTRPRPARR